MQRSSRRSKTTLLVSLISASLLLLSVACSDDTETPDSSVPDVGAQDAAPDLTSDTSPDVGTDSAPPDAVVVDAAATVTITGALKDFVSVAAVAGVDVCILGATGVPCVKTDNLGTFKLPQVPDGVDLQVSMKKTGYMSYAAPYGAGQVSKNYTLSLLSDAVATGLLTAVGTSIKSGKGHIILSVGGTAYAGAAFSLNKSSGEGPYYLNSLGLPEKTLTATSSAGFGFVVNMDPGDYELTFSNSGKTCALHQGWKGSSSNMTKVKVLADTANSVVIVCN